ncbi:MAG: isoprenylcysteine carboxylmethyltransferase family protein [Nanoarchaeota archaeon]|nr:isoprenylcysteine carboxylmethyltransferase family protein [Nanoarchaeota archaeon]MBU0977692.1 isoprenylcysteine carboxylmethyltransferase family protein [Nanoarchaeota archaeon]
MVKKILPPTYFYLGLIFIVLTHFFFPISKIIFFPFNLLGIILILLGTALNLFAWSHFIKNNTTQNPHKQPSKFIQDGVYKLSRNPMYLGMLAILFGVSVLFGDLLSFLFPILFLIIMNWFFIPLEEKNMEKQFGKKYREYKNKVGRWI